MTAIYAERRPGTQRAGTNMPQSSWVRYASTRLFSSAPSFFRPQLPLSRADPVGEAYFLFLQSRRFEDDGKVARSDRRVAARHRARAEGGGDSCGAGRRIRPRRPRGRIGDGSRGSARDRTAQPRSESNARLREGRCRRRSRQRIVVGRHGDRRNSPSRGRVVELGGGFVSPAAACQAVRHRRASTRRRSRPSRLSSMSSPGILKRFS